MNHVDLNTVLDRTMLRQYRDSPLLQAWASRMAVSVQDGVVDVAEELHGWPNPSKLRYWTLDMLGSLIAMPRPVILYRDSDGGFFGFKGASGYVPGGFGSLMADKETLRTSLVEVSDVWYRRLLSARLARLTSNASYGQILRIGQELEPPESRQSTLVLASGTWELRLRIPSVTLRLALARAEVQSKIFPFPIGVQHTIKFI